MILKVKAGDPITNMATKLTTITLVMSSQPMKLVTKVGPKEVTPSFNLTVLPAPSITKLTPGTDSKPPFTTKAGLSTSPMAGNMPNLMRKRMKGGPKDINTFRTL